MSTLARLAVAALNITIALGYIRQLYNGVYLGKHAAIRAFMAAINMLLAGMILGLILAGV